VHDREHYMRIIASALPLLQMLATGETGLMLAPKVDDFEDEREIWDIDKIIARRPCCTWASIRCRTASSRRPLRR
jgi:conjugal transfer pilus assembly protein TraD